MNPSEIKRFIAGAVCPRCQAMDRVVMYRQGERQMRACVACGFEDEMRFQSRSSELPTRVNQDDSQTTTVRILGSDQ